MTKCGKAIKYMVKNAKARKILKKVKKMRKKHDVCACVGVRVADNKISGSEQEAQELPDKGELMVHICVIKSSHGRLTGLAVLQEWSGEGSDESLIAAKYIVF